MILHIFAVRDRATDQFGNPLFYVAMGQAIRAFTDEVNRADKDNGFYAHPDDYDLYELGTYDTDLGLFESQSPKMICIGKNVSVRSNSN